MTQKQAERLVKEFRTYLASIRDGAIRCKGKAEVTGHCDAETDEERQGLNLLCQSMSGIVKEVDESLKVLRSLEACLGAKK